MPTAYGPILKTQQPRILAVLLGLMLLGCASRMTPVAQSEFPWQWQDFKGKSILSEHYLIHTTIADEAINQRLVRTMEASMTRYRALVPDLPLDPRRLECFVFATRREWAEFTIATTGQDAALYLQMVHGGYTIGDRFVCYLGNEPDMRAIAAHEGFHQFCGRNFKARLCPALEEGLATQFETIPGDNIHPGQPLPIHIRHASMAAGAYRQDTLIPLPTLLQLDAGDVVRRTPALTFIFYGQCWALARFLSTDPTYQPRLHDLLFDAATGRLLPATQPTTGPATTPSVASMTTLATLQHYLGDLTELERRYRQYLSTLKLENDERLD